MYGYVVNIESSQPLRRLSITELGFDKIVENNLINLKINESDSNNYSFNLRPIEAINNINEGIIARNAIRLQPLEMSQMTSFPPNIVTNNGFFQNPKNDITINSNGYNNNNNNVKSNKVAPLQSEPPPQAFGSNTKIPEANTGDFEVLWHKLSYSLVGISLKSTSRKKILKNLYGCFRSGEVTAIMGPSGAGKSTLLEIICGRRTRGVDGEIRIRGLDEIKVGFVPQDNYLLELLTVKESFVFSSRLINVKNKSFDHLKASEALIRRFGLDPIADTKAKHCSGGQRKRLSIALEVLSNPNLLILDEPTTGLDSPSCTHVVNIMKELVSDKRHPTAIVTTIHQPSVSLFKSFNRVYVLSSNGRCIYQGTSQGLVPTLSKCGIQCARFTSPADFIIEVAANDYGPAPIKKLITEAENQEMERLVTTGTKTLASASKLISHPFWDHLKILFIRSQITLYRDPFLTFLRIIMAIFSACSLAIMFGREVGKVSGCAPRELELYATPITILSKKFEHDLNMIMQNVCLLFLGIMVGFLSGLTPTLLNFPKEMHVFHKEYHNGWYSCITYYIAKMLSDVPLQVITPLIYIFITYFYSNQPLEMFRFSWLTVVSVLLSFLAQSIGECTSAIWMENQNAAVFAGGLVPLPMILFGGFLVKIERMPVYLQPVSWFSFLRFAFEAMMISTYGFGRCEYQYKEFLSTVNVSAITKPLWAQSLPIMLEYLERKRGNDFEEDREITDEESIQRLYSVFGGSMAKGENGIDLNKSLILSFYELEDYNLFISVGILAVYMATLKVLTYYVLLAKLHSTK